MSTQLPSTKATEEEISPFDDESFFPTFIKDNPCFETLQQIHSAIKSWERQTSERTSTFLKKIRQQIIEGTNVHFI